ncbi:MAG: hypothetical protein E6G92_03325 [Alphaproteobacteria bacterium]|nr:MAG: hypothetical protein E6G92_03325 [Alphaproteobacteria bacterium]
MNNDGTEPMVDIDPRFAEALAYDVNADVIGLTPAVSLASLMVAHVATVARDQLAASNQYQLNAMSAMLELTREYGERGARTSLAVKEALDLVKQVVATAQASS